MCVCVCAHPVVELWGELGQEAADGSFAVVSLYEHLCYQRCAVPQLLKVVELRRQDGKSGQKWSCGSKRSRSPFTFLFFFFFFPLLAGSPRQFNLWDPWWVSFARSEMSFFHITQQGHIHVVRERYPVTTSKSVQAYLTLALRSSCINRPTCSDNALKDIHFTALWCWMVCFTSKQPFPWEAYSSNQMGQRNLSPADLNYSP